MSDSQFTEILALLESKTWKRPYEFERKYKSQLSTVVPHYIQTRGLTAAQLETTVKQSVKQQLNKYLTSVTMREGEAVRDIGYDEVCFKTKTTWKDSDVGYCVAVLAKGVALKDFRIDRDSSNCQEKGWAYPFDLHIFSGVTEDLKYNILKERDSRYVWELKKTVTDPPLSKEEQSAAVSGILATAQDLYDSLDALGLLGNGLNVALVTNVRNTTGPEVNVGLVFDPSLMSTIFKSISDGHIDLVAHHVLLYNILTSKDLDYRTLSPSEFSAIDSVVDAFIDACPVPLEVDDWYPTLIDDCPPFGDKYAKQVCWDEVQASNCSGGVFVE